MTANNQPPKTLAETALAILDARGEFAMLPYLMDNAEPGVDDKDWREEGHLELADGSQVKHGKGQYEFRWPNGANGDDVCQQRPAAMPESGRPEPTGTHPAILNDPTADDVWSRTIQILEEEQKLELPEPAIDRESSYRAAPNLFSTIRSISTSGRHNNLLDKHHAAILTDCAIQVMRTLPAEELEALRAAIARGAMNA